MPYPISSWRFIAKWWMGSLLNTAGAMAQPLQGTMMMPFWLRAMGATVGKNVEFSSTKGVALDTLTLGDGTFVADSVMCGMPSVSQGTMRSRPVHIKPRAFVGNGSLVREGSVLGEDSLIALQTAAPRLLKPESTFLGSPPLSIEKREKALGANHLTYHPSRCRKCKCFKRRRACIAYIGKHCRLTFSMNPPSFKPVSLSLSRISSILKHPNKSFFNPINIFDSFTHTLLQR